MKTEKHTNTADVAKAFEEWESGRVKMHDRDYNILLAMLSNLESFLVDAHKKAQHTDAPSFTVGWSVKRELTQEEKDIEFLKEVAREFEEHETNEGYAMAEKINGIIRRLTGVKA